MICVPTPDLDIKSACTCPAMLVSFCNSRENRLGLAHVARTTREDTLPESSNPGNPPYNHRHEWWAPRSNKTTLAEQNHLANWQAHENCSGVICANLSADHSSHSLLIVINTCYLHTNVFFLIVNSGWRQEKLSNYRVSLHYPGCSIIPRQKLWKVISSRRAKRIRCSRWD